MQRFKFSATALLAMLFFAASLHAQTTYYGSDPTGASQPTVSAARSAFTSSLASYGVETFGAQVPGTCSPLVSAFGGFASGTFTPTTCGAGASTTYDGAYFPPDPTTYHIFSVTGGLAMTLALGSQVQALGFWAGDWAWPSDTWTLEFWRGGAFVDFWVAPSEPSSAAAWLGYTNSAGFDEVRFYTTSSGDGVLFDDVTIGTVGAVVPEPASMTLLATGLVGMMGAGMKRRRKKA